MIELDGVSKVYRGPQGLVEALADVSLRVDGGEFVAVCGPSGCGKTTLLSIVGALVRPTRGRVVIAGNEISVMSPGARSAFRAANIGFVFQMFHLLPYLTVLENVLVAASREADRAQAGQLLERFGLSGRLGHRPAELSAGERQRVAIARALMHRPPLVLADEPTGNLDGQSAAEVLEILKDFHRDGGTVLLVTHQEQAAAAAGRVILLRAGQVVGPSGGSLEKPNLVR